MQKFSIMSGGGSKITFHGERIAKVAPALGESGTEFQIYRLEDGSYAAQEILHPRGRLEKVRYEASLCPTVEAVKECLGGSDNAKAAYVQAGFDPAPEAEGGSEDAEP